MYYVYDHCKMKTMLLPSVFLPSVSNILVRTLERTRLNVAAQK
jgi:hypothetical protein